MITTAREMAHTQQRMQELERAIASAKERYRDRPEVFQVLAESHRHQLEELRAEVEEYLGFKKVQAPTVELKFDTEDGGGMSPLSVLESVVANFRCALTNIAESVSMGRARESGRPKASIARMVDMMVVGTAPGSFRILMEPPLQKSVTEESLAEKSLGILSDAVEWIAVEGTPPPSLENTEVRKTALRQVQRLAPSKGSQLAYVEISHRRPGRPAARPAFRLTRETHVRATEVLKEELPEKAASATGYLREIDLDNRTFEINTTRAKGKGKRTRCRVPPDLLDDALSYIHSQEKVTVRGTKRGQTIEVSLIIPPK